MMFSHAEPKSKRLGLRVLLMGLVLTAAACSFKNGYYKDDGPPGRVKPSDIARIPDAVPRNEPRSSTGNRPYEALGKTYYPMNTAQGYQERGVASWYGKKFHGNRTSSGEKYDMLGMTAAHRVLPLPTYVRVRSLDNGRTVVVKVNDRGPFLHNRLIDLSYAAAYKLGIVATGTGLVEVAVVQPGSASHGTVPKPKPVYQVPVNSHNVSGIKLFVQFGAFAIKSNAEDMRRRLYSQGFHPVIEPGLHNGQSIYRVRVGPYSQVSEVDQITASSRQYGYETKLIIE